MDKLKKGTNWYGIQPEMVMCDNIISTIFNEEVGHCIRTAGPEKGHGTGSLHPPGFAIDYRTKNIMYASRVATINKIAHKIKDQLPCCDVVIEDLGGENEHIHVEFDPKDDMVFQSAKKVYQDTGMWPARW